MIRRRIREEGFTRRIIPPVPVTNDDLDRVLTHDRPVIIEDMEPLSKGAKTIPFYCCEFLDRPVALDRGAGRPVEGVKSREDHAPGCQVQGHNTLAGPIESE
jgi:hypothetical protein